MKQNNKTRILEEFYENPNKEFTIRELSKSTKIPKSTIQRELKILKNKGLITKENKVDNNLLFKIKKINFYIEKIVSVGLIDYLIEKLNPTCIILFGSIRKGESNNESDIDLFVETPIKKTINLNKFEKKLKHAIQLFTESNINRLPENLFNNVTNGIKLYGSFKIKIK
jgi:predicted nucleotidyltransferase